MAPAADTAAAPCYRNIYRRALGAARSRIGVPDDR
jgi:hypothetical protein